MTAKPQSGSAGQASAGVAWAAAVREAPGLAATVKSRFLAHRHHVLATLRADGSPRLRGVEVQFVGDDLCVGMMAGSRKAADLAMETRLAIHSHPDDHGSPLEAGDAVIEGHAEPITSGDALDAYIDAVAPPEPFVAFRILVTRVLLTSMQPAENKLVLDWWTPQGGHQRSEVT